MPAPGQLGGRGRTAGPGPGEREREKVGSVGPGCGQPCSTGFPPCAMGIPHDSHPCLLRLLTPPRERFPSSGGCCRAQMPVSSR